MKAVESLTVDDLAANAVWAFVNSDGRGESMVRPVKAIPVANTAGKLFGTRVSLANGTTAWALLGNVVALSPRETLHLLPRPSSGTVAGSTSPDIMISITRTAGRQR